MVLKKMLPLVYRARTDKLFVVYEKKCDKRIGTSMHVPKNVGALFDPTYYFFLGINNIVAGYWLVKLWSDFNGHSKSGKCSSQCPKLDNII